MMRALTLVLAAIAGAWLPGGFLVPGNAPPPAPAAAPGPADAYARLPLILPAAAPAPAGADARLPLTPPAAAPGPADAYARLPLTFEANQGQADPSVRFLSRGPAYTVLLTDRETIIRLAGGRAPLRVTLAGSAPPSRVVPVDRQTSRSHYLLGNEPGLWHRDVPSYAAVRYERVYDGIDVVYYGNQHQLEHDFLVAPSADPRQIEIDFGGADTVEVEASGDLLVRMPDDELRLHKPVAYQEASERRPVAARYVRSGRTRVRFDIGTYDTARPLVIDPVLSYASYGGGGGADYAFGVAVDGSGNAYITGTTDSLDFPTTTGAFSRTFSGTFGVPPGGDVFVTKLNAAGAVVYSTYIGGDRSEKANAIAVDSSGNAYITGGTGSTNFPTTAGSVQPKWGNYPFSSNGDGFVTKLNASGSALVYSTFLGGESLTEGFGIAVDASGNAYVAGHAWYYFNTPNPSVHQTTTAFSDAFVAKVNASGASLGFATLLGGNDLDEAYGVALDSSGNVVIIGRTSSFNLPVKNAAQGTYGGSQDAFVAKFSPGGVSVYSTFLGGNDLETAGGIAVDPSGNAYVTGRTSSTNFPVTAGVLQPTASAFGDAYVTKLTASGAFSYSTFLGGDLGEAGTAIAVAPSGNAFVTGTTQSSNFPVRSALQATLASPGGKDIFLTELNAAGAATVMSTYFGGTGLDEGYAIALDASLNVYLAGRTVSTNFPTLAPFQATNRGGSDLVVARIRTVLPSMSLDRSTLAFSALSTGAALSAKTGTQAVRLTQTGAGTVTWAASSTTPWLVVSPNSGAGSATLNLSVQFAAGLVATQTGSVTLTFTGAANSAGPIVVTFNTITSTSAAAPVGSFDTPLEGATGLAGSIAVTGWAMDDVEVTRVRILRDPAAGEPAGQLVPIGDAVLVDGARPDVQASFPTLPRATRAGWGYLLLTNFLPGLGTGTYRLHAFADDADGHSTLLGIRTIACANGTAITPFGAIDTPLQGETVSGTINDFGWVLSPGARRADPPSGGTVSVLVDGNVVGSPTGWVNRPDLAALFPAAQFSGIGNALGVYTLDTSTLTNGVHTIAWIVTDSLGGGAGVGSRYFTVSNGAGLTQALNGPHQPRVETQGHTLREEPVTGRRGLDLGAPFQTFLAGPDGRITIQSEELDRIELQLGAGATGYSGAAGSARPLPIGSRIDPDTGVFTWHPGAGFLGAFDLVLAGRDVRIVINPKGSGRVGPQTIIDTPTAVSTNASLPARADGLIVAGWSVDLDSTVDSGVDALHVWAYPVDGGAPIFVGVADYGGARPDVATIHGARFLKSGYGLHVAGLAPGTYDLAVFAHSTVKRGFTPAKVVRVTVR